VELALEADAAGDPKPLVEIEQVDATAQQHVLAVVDDFSGVAGQRIRSCAASQEGARFEDLNVIAGAAERRGGRQSGQSSSGDEYIRHQAGAGDWEQF
jgi:hypothetical protein